MRRSTSPCKGVNQHTHISMSYQDAHYSRFLREMAAVKYPHWLVLRITTGESYARCVRSLSYVTVSSFTGRQKYRTHSTEVTQGSLISL